MQKLLVSLFLTAFLAGCSGFPGVYKIDVPQGNVITQEMVDQLKPGLTKRQVRFVMGSPLVEDSFHSDRWDYIYTLQKGDGSYEKQQLRLFFEGDKLSSLNGDFRPSPGN
ncbi:outer membrane protein assembly factor BamE [Marinobacterium jannaschii]|uniref:outer membrane protein assembly factor BamE n=1 Tax=Marinobacterium jannaschii TaxID=64970 RepID=UPI00047F7DEE|nr:outer membrane protein assembly factor BamE [Marinobacterium jannaschii]